MLKLMIKTPEISHAREQELWENHVAALIGAYTMSE